MARKRGGQQALMVNDLAGNLLMGLMGGMRMMDDGITHIPISAKAIK
jgi:hypothetical protein